MKKRFNLSQLIHLYFFEHNRIYQFLFYLLDMIGDSKGLLPARFFYLR